VAKPSIPGSEIAELFRRAIRGEVKVEAVSSDWGYCGDARIVIAGYDLTIFNDCDELDYVDSATAPDGRHTEFEEWWDAADSPVDMLSDEEIAEMERLLENAPVVKEVSR
jgi:probable phosphoglycerate mutase